jgi:glutathione synthase/RimK-type ligase-like ATP-grasp enzyme
LSRPTSSSTNPLLFVTARRRRQSGRTTTARDSIGALAAVVGPLPPGGDRSTVLLLTRKGEEGSERIARELMRRGEAVRRFDVDTFGNGSTASLRIDGGAPGGSLELSTGALPLSSVKSVWFRRYPTRVMLEVPATRQADEFAWQESNETLASLPVFCAHARWVNAPAATQRAAGKPGQLAAARAIGLVTPRTLVTNNPVEARRFLATGRGSIVAKSFNWLFGASDGDLWVVQAQRIRKHERKRLDRLATAPCILQEEIPRAAELRVVIVGGRTFVMATRSSRGARGPADWRDPEARVSHDRGTIPAALQRRCRMLLRGWGLEYAAFDFIRRPDGEHVFLEINTHGNWLPMEAATGLPITAAIADLLQTTQ